MTTQGETYKDIGPAPETPEEQLNFQEAIISDAVANIEQHQRRFDEAWADVFKIFDKLYGRDLPARFVCDDGFTLARQVPQPTQTINAEELHNIIVMNHSPLMATRLWNDITDQVRVLNHDKLAQVIERGRLEPDLVLEATKTKQSTPTRNRRPATKEDKAALAEKNRQETNEQENTA